MLTKEQVDMLITRLYLFTKHVNGGIGTLRYRVIKQVRKDLDEEDTDLLSWLGAMRTRAPISPIMVLDMYRKRKLLTYEDYNAVLTALLEMEMAKV